MPRLATRELLRLRARAQGLARAGARSFVDTVRASVGLQAQDATAGLLAARARTAGLTLEETRRARLQERSVVRAWVMRGTLHFVAADDLGWMLPLFGPLYEARDRPRREQLGLDAEAVDRGLGVVRDLLANGGPQTREPIRVALAAAGIPHEGQAVAHLLLVAALRGLVCCSDDRGGGTHEFALLEDWSALGPELPRGAALEALARRYLTASGPAAIEDFIAWSGLPVRDAREGWERIRSDCVDLETPEGSMWTLRTADPAAARRRTPIVRLLPRFDTYLLSYRSRNLALRSEHARRVLPGGGILNSTVLLDGRLVGVWQLKRARHRLTVEVEPFEALSAAVRHAIEVEAADIGRFLGVPAVVTYAKSAPA